MLLTRRKRLNIERNDKQQKPRTAALNIPPKRCRQCAETVQRDNEVET